MSLLSKAYHLISSPATHLDSFPHPLQSYLSSTPFLSILQSLETLFFVAAAKGDRHPVRYAFPAYQQFLDDHHVYNTIARNRLWTSMLWNSVVLYWNAQTIQSIPRFRFGSAAERLVFIMNLIGAVVLVSQLVIAYLDRSADYRWEGDRARALEWYYDSPRESVRKWKAHLLSMALWVHGFCVLQWTYVRMAIRITDMRGLGLESQNEATQLNDSQSLAIMSVFIMACGGMFGSTSVFIGAAAIPICYLGLTLRSTGMTGAFNWGVWTIVDALVWMVLYLGREQGKKMLKRNFENIVQIVDFRKV